jgi:23S rRNA pseudouridine2605 synthase
VAKRYRVTVEGEPGLVEVTNLRGGIMLDDGMAVFSHMHVIEPGPPTTTFIVELKEGRKRQIRRMFSAIGHPVVKLERIAYGALKIGRLPRGEARPLEEDEVAELRDFAGLSEPEPVVDKGEPDAE